MAINDQREDLYAAGMLAPLRTIVKPTPQFYVASRAHHGAMWQRYYLSGGYAIISTWIHEYQQGESNMVHLWQRIFQEIAQCDVLLFYARPEDFPLKGALLEAGAALVLGKPVRVVVPGLGLERPSLRPLGSWALHPLVKRYLSIGHAFTDTGGKSFGESS